MLLLSSEWHPAHSVKTRKTKKHEHFDVHVTMQRDKFLINQLDALISQICFGRKLHVSDSSSAHHQEFFTVHTAMVCHTGLLTACEQDQDGVPS